MKKYFMLVAIFCIAVPGYASKKKISYAIHQHINSGKRVPPDSAPSKLPFEIFYDDSDGVIEIESEENLEGLVILYGKSRQVEDTSLSINSTLVPTSSGLHEVEIYYDCWICTAYIEI